jgi:hypothetical protein
MKASRTKAKRELGAYSKREIGFFTADSRSPTDRVSKVRGRTDLFGSLRRS